MKINNIGHIKTLLELSEMTREELEHELINVDFKDRNASRNLARRLVAAGNQGIYTRGGMNRYANEFFGFDIRDEIQGIYETAKVLRGIQKGKIPLSLQEFEKAGNSALIKLSSIYANQPKYLSEACDVIRAGRGKITQRLKEIIARKSGATHDDPSSIQDSKMNPQNAIKKKPATMPECLKNW